MAVIVKNIFLKSNNNVKATDQDLEVTVNYVSIG